MYKKITYLVLCMAFIGAHANMNDDLNSLYDTSSRNVSKVDKTNFANIKNMASANKAGHMAFIKGLFEKKIKGRRRGGKSLNGAALFVSFSMPTKLILSLADNANSYGIPVVIKGLVDGDFKKTIQTFYSLQRLAKKEHYNFSGVSIDPVWFGQFNITVVPALVTTIRPASCQYQQMCPNQPYDVVFGNSSIEDSLRLISEKGDTTREVAKRILGQGNA